MLFIFPKCLHANSARPFSDQADTVQFHPSAQVVMTAGLDQSILPLPGASSLTCRGTPHPSAWSATASRWVATGVKNKMFLHYDMMEWTRGASFLRQG
uniref:Uncharacterized protein n=1 Tax=Gadus morhua TaxID=8049 RepID=A0A8C5D557_GADMO